jgi:hypothetical protein
MTVIVHFVPGPTQASGPKAAITFKPWSQAAVDIVKAVPNSRFNRPDKSWTIPTHRLDQVLPRFHRAGMAIVVAGKVWTPAAVRAHRREVTIPKVYGAVGPSMVRTDIGRAARDPQC